MTRIQTLLEMRQAIEQLTARLDAIEEWIAPDDPQEDAGQPLTLMEGPTLDPQAALISRIEELVATRIGNWKYAKQDADGSWRAPLTASSIAEALGHSAMWREVARAMKGPGWTRLSWFKAPPPPNWRGGDSDAKWIQWVTVRDDA